jgi:hypothetical protein
MGNWTQEASVGAPCGFGARGRRSGVDRRSGMERCRAAVVPLGETKPVVR